MTIFDSTYRERQYFSKGELLCRTAVTVKGLLLSPGRFFQDIMDGKVNASCLAYLIFFCIVYVTGEALIIREERWLLISVFFLNAFLTPFLLALVLYLVSIPFCGKSFTYERMFMITAYSSVTLLAAWIPGVAWLAGIWRLYLIGLGMTKVGDISGRKALAILIVAAVIIIFLFQFLRPIISYL